MNPYPILSEMLKQLALDNDMCFRKVKRWEQAQTRVAYRFSDLELQARCLSEEERYTLICGEFTEVTNLVAERGVGHLDDF